MRIVIGSSECGDVDEMRQPGAVPDAANARPGPAKPLRVGERTTSYGTATLALVFLTIGASGCPGGRNQPLPVPANTVGTTTPNGTTTSTGLKLTDDVAPQVDIEVTPDGAASVHIPLWVPPGRAGVQPSLSLEYNSRAGLSLSGILGAGWHIGGLPLIHRCARTAVDNANGVSAPIRFDATDQLCIDGEPLVPENRAAKLQKGTVLRAFHDDHRRFVIQDTDSAGPTAIVAYGRDGRITTWGNSIAPGLSHFGGALNGKRYSFSTFAGNPGWKNIQVNAATARYGWLLAGDSDHNGNLIQYTWNASLCGGEDFLPGYGLEFSPAVINYTANPTTGLQPRKTIVFDYKNTGCDNPHGNSPIYIAGMRFDPRMQLNDIRVLGPSNDGSNNIVLRQYNFSYGNDAPTPQLPQSAVRPELVEFLDCDDGGIPNSSWPNYASSVCRPPVHFYYGEIGPLDNEWVDLKEDSKQPNAPQIGVIPTVSNGLTFPPRIYVADLNRDGRDDLLYGQKPNPTTYVAQASTGPWTSPTLSPVVQTGPSFYEYGRLFPNDFYGTGFPTAFLATVDGSGAATLMALDSSGKFATIPMNGNPNPLDGTTAAEMADLDGNGVPDLVETQTPLTQGDLGWDYRLNYGQGVLVAGASLPGGGLLPTGPNDHRLIDVDGDGSQEILTVLSLKDPTRFSAVHAEAGVAVNSAAVTTLDVDNAIQSPRRPYVFADLNGDGLTDAIEFGEEVGDGTIFIRFNSGNGFFPPVVYVPPIQFAFGDEWAMRTIDFNADGKQDILLRTLNVIDPRHPENDKAPVYVLWFDGYDMHLDPLPFPTVYSSTAPNSIDQQEMFEVGDVNGDGLDDILMVNDYATDNPATGVLHLFVRSQSARKNRALIEVDRTGLTRDGAKIPGEATEIFYQPIIDNSVYADNGDECTATKHPWVCVESKLWVVSEIRRLNDVSFQPTNETAYTYFGARSDLRGRGFLGFERIMAYDWVKDLRTVSFYDLQAKENKLSFYPFVGTPIEVATQTHYTAADGSQTLWTRLQQSTLTIQHTTNSSYFVYPGTLVDTVAEQYANSTTATLYKHTTTNVLDDNGNLTTSTTARDDGSADTVGHQYLYITANEPWPRIFIDYITETSLASGQMLSRQRNLMYDNNWNINFVDSFPVGNNDRGEQELWVSYTPTPEGLPQTIQYQETNNRGGATRSLNITYDPYEHAAPSVVTDTLGHIRRYAVHPGYGVLAVSEDENLLKTTYTYDGLLRPASVSFPTGEKVSYDYVSVTGDPLKPVEPDTLVRVVTQLASGARDISETNWQGHQTARRTVARPDGKVVYESYVYDNYDRLMRYYPPSFALAGSTPLVRSYDSLDRISTEKRSDGSSWKYTYHGLQTQTNDLTDKITTTSTIDGQGRVVQTQEFLKDKAIYAYATAYAYGPFNTVHAITDSQGNVILRETNRLGSLWHLHDPDSGDRHYAYNAFGDLETETTPQYTTTRLYDGIGRLKTETTGSRVATFTYDTAANGSGKIANEVSPDGITTAFGYDSQGHLSSETWTIASEQFAIGNSYDPQGRLSTITYPAVAGQAKPFSVTYNYDPTFGVLQSITDTNTPSTAYWTWKDSDASGVFTTELFGNNTTDVRSESTAAPTTLGRIQVTLNAGSPSAQILRDVSYQVDGQLNVTNRLDNINGRSEKFTYDTLSRLKTWQWLQGSTVAQQNSYIYDALGNLTSKTIDVGTGTNQAFTIDPTKGGPHQIASSGYRYDGNGRQTVSPGRTTTFNEFDLPATITGSNAIDSFQFSYDGEANRVLKKQPSRATTVTLGDLYERVTPEAGSPQHRFTVMGPDRPIAIVEMSGTTTGIFYLHAGHTESVELVTDDSGNVVDRLAYDPFGSRIQSTPPERLLSSISSPVDVGFSGMRHDDEATLDLINMHGRIYDPLQARFLSADPLLTALGSQAINPYSYVRNNPLTLRDPSGFQDDGGTPSDAADLTKYQNYKSQDGQPTDADQGKKAQITQPPTSGPSWDGRQPITPTAAVASGALKLPDNYGKPLKSNPNNYANRAIEAVPHMTMTAKEHGAVAIAVPVAVGGVFVAGGEALAGLGLRVGIRVMLRWPLLIPTLLRVGNAINGGPELPEAPAGTSLSSLPRSLNGGPAVGAVLENAGPIVRSLGAGSKPEMIAKRLGLNINSPTSRQILNSLDMRVVDFIGKYRAGGIRGVFPSEFLERTVEEALLEGGSTVRKLLTDTRFVK